VASTNEGNEELRLAASLLEFYYGQSMSVGAIRSGHYRLTRKPLLLRLLSLLESRGRVYIERRPRLEDGHLRTSIADQDIVFFDTFPTIRRRTLLYKTAVEYGDHTINHVLGCAHGCNYPCYAMQMSKRYGRVSSCEDWMYPRMVGNAIELLDKEIPLLNSKIQFVHLSFMTDPFMYDAVNKRNFPWVQNLTLEIIRHLNQADIKVTVLTKGRLPIDLKNEPFNKENEYGITLVSLSPAFQKHYEPFSYPAGKRLAALRVLHGAGLKTWVSLEPYPTPNIIEQDLTKLLNKISFVDKLIFGKWNYNPEVNGYESHRRFYTRSSDTVIDFCREHDIALHIKEHTPRSRHSTQGLFVREV